MQEVEQPKPPMVPEDIPSSKIKSLGDFKTKQPLMDMPTIRNEPLFVKVDVYQELLTKMNELKLDFSHLRHTNNQLQQSEFNEVNSFEKLRKSMKNIC